ncbi:hypothetical protein LK542_20545 [Massilia sp. IC2-477]|uniref:hypothetical protein n=1 Tax=Massilia sp. IC2-477 TaxID=2887198 RepID=UPI001D11F427|nr:hypothetical protein [Massilia sp. IC2-477]MCC2958015.1 hypothetical protein [Massilia sp. IC2-477]
MPFGSKISLIGNSAKVKALRFSALSTEVTHSGFKRGRTDWKFRSLRTAALLRITSRQLSS